MTNIERFENLFMPEPNTGCWIWIGCVSLMGYGQFKSGRLRQAHRFAYESYIGPIPTGLQLDHKCRVRQCVNPHHLEAVTCRENILRGIGLAAIRAKQTHCKRGHPFDAENTARFKNERICRTCRKAKLKHWRAKQK